MLDVHLVACNISLAFLSAEVSDASLSRLVAHTCCAAVLSTVNSWPAGHASRQGTQGPRRGPGARVRAPRILTAILRYLGQDRVV